MSGVPPLYGIPLARGSNLNPRGLTQVPGPYDRTYTYSPLQGYAEWGGEALPAWGEKHGPYLSLSLSLSFSL